MLRAVGFKEVLTTRLDGNAGKRKVSINRSVLCRVTNFQGRRERERKLLRLGASDQGRCWHLYRNDLLIIALCRGIKFILFFFFFLIKLFFLSIFSRIKIYSPNIAFTYIIIYVNVSIEKLNVIELKSVINPGIFPASALKALKL